MFTYMYKKYIKLVTHIYADIQTYKHASMHTNIHAIYVYLKACSEIYAMYLFPQIHSYVHKNYIYAYIQPYKQPTT